MNSNIFAGRTLLITGGTGTFGNAVVDMASKTGFAEIRIFSRDEKRQDHMRRRLKNTSVKFYLGDVRNYDSVLAAMCRVDFVFHAAALRQVPSCEFFPIEAVQMNTLGTENVMKAALASSVSKVIVLSTDKAVYPVNAMGTSMALIKKYPNIYRITTAGDNTNEHNTRDRWPRLHRHQSHPRIEVKGS